MDYQLNKADSSTLNSILGLNLEAALAENLVDNDLEPDAWVPTKKVQKLVEEEKRAILFERDGKYDEALDIFDAIIASEPLYASAYNNRAQMRRILDQSQDSILADLIMAINLASPAQPEQKVSSMQALVLRSAYNQLAAVYMSQSDLPDNANEAWDLQLQASECMVRSAKYGESAAIQLAARMNPYSKLCGNILELAMNQGQ